MKIALLGYGKMGKAIEQIAIERGHEIVLRITSSNKESLSNGDLKKADVVIEFTNPRSAVSNIQSCFAFDVPVVCGTTGWNDRLKVVKDECNAKQQALLYASNFSIGVNLFFAINNYAAKLFSKQSAYVPSVEEIHHIHKLDSPSGTGITIAEGILNEYKEMSGWKLKQSESENVSESENKEKLSINAIRTGEVPGTHTVFYNSEIDTIELKHTAHNRKGFALGAVVAAEWLHGKKGCFTMQHVLNLPTPDGSI
jgi:4-hydroxy-tetrahydrodipicolinate reductase